MRRWSSRKTHLSSCKAFGYNLASRTKKVCFDKLKKANIQNFKDKIREVTNTPLGEHGN